MAETKRATNSLTKGNNGAVTEKKPNKTIYEIIKAGEKQFAAALPKHLNSERFTRIAITTIRQNPKLAECNAESLLGSLMTIAQLGLEPGVLGQCYLIPFKNNKLGTIECQFQLGYKGMIELLRRTGQLSDIYAYTVYSNDEFDIEYGLDRTLKHKPAFTNPEGRGEIVGFYSVAILKDGTIVEEGAEEELKNKALGYIWEVVPESIRDREKIITEHLVSKIYESNDSIRIRVISENRPNIKARKVEPTLEDIYLMHFQREGKEL